MKPADLKLLKSGDLEGTCACSPASQDRGCHNINLISPSHVVAQIIAAVDLGLHRFG